MKHFDEIEIFLYMLNSGEMSEISFIEDKIKATFNRSLSKTGYYSRVMCNLYRAINTNYAYFSKDLKASHTLVH